VQHALSQLRSGIESVRQGKKTVRSALDGFASGLYVPLMMVAPKISVPRGAARESKQSCA
jgi:hypothetical protein